MFLENDGNVPVFPIRIQIRMIHEVLDLTDPELDLFVRGTEPRIRIRTKMSGIPNTGSNQGGA